MPSPGRVRIAVGKTGSAISNAVSPFPVGRLVHRKRIKYKIRLFPFLTGSTGRQANRQGEKIMTDKIISIEEHEGPFQMVFQRVMRMVPDRDKHDKKLQRLIAFRLKIDGEAAISEYLIKKIKEAIKCSYRGSLYDYLKDDVEARECKDPTSDDTPPGAA
jgi:hypothetical protein